jgi:predicted nucleic acid-binding protein
MQHAKNSLPITGEYVLDSYALIAYFEAEPGSERIHELLEASKEGKCHLYISVVNLGELIYVTERERGLSRAHETLARVDELPIEVIDADRSLTLAAAHLKAECPVAYADCFAAALCNIKGATLITGDPEFRKVKTECNFRVEWLNN